GRAGVWGGWGGGRRGGGGPGGGRGGGGGGGGGEGAGAGAVPAVGGEVVLDDLHAVVAQPVGVGGEVEHVLEVLPAGDPVRVGVGEVVDAELHASSPVQDRTGAGGAGGLGRAAPGGERAGSGGQLSPRPGAGSRTHSALRAAL